MTPSHRRHTITIKARPSSKSQSTPVGQVDLRSHFSVERHVAPITHRNWHLTPNQRDRRELRPTIYRHSHVARDLGETLEANLLATIKRSLALMALDLEPHVSASIILYAIARSALRVEDSLPCEPGVFSKLAKALDAASRDERQKMQTMMAHIRRWNPVDPQKQHNDWLDAAIGKPA